jgi:type VI secretion system secreted protein VgrG
VVSAVSYDYKAKRSVVMHVPGARPVGGEHAPVLESYDDPDVYAWANSAEAERYGRLAMEAREARQRSWLGCGTVRSLRPGWCFDLIDAPQAKGSEALRRFAVLGVTHVGINNLSGETMDVVAARLAKGGFLNADAGALATEDALSPVHAPIHLAETLLRLAAERGYANSFEA